MILLYPMMFLSGAFFSLKLLPAAIQKVSAFMPLTYVVNLLNGLWVGEPWGSHLLDVWRTAGMLLLGSSSRQKLSAGNRFASNFS